MIKLTPNETLVLNKMLSDYKTKYYTGGICWDFDNSFVRREYFDNVLQSLSSKFPFIVRDGNRTDAFVCDRRILFDLWMKATNPPAEKPEPEYEELLKAAGMI